LTTVLAQNAGYDLVVVGAGILGLATAREYLSRRPGEQVAVLEKESRVAMHQTGRNSGVIHSGIYYAPGSLKATLCVSGGAMLKAYCRDQGIPYGECGKVIVATSEAELPALAELERRGRANGVVGLRSLSPGELRTIEPAAAGIAALHVPQTAIVDYTRVAEAMAADIRRMGGAIITSAGVNRIHREHGSWRLETRGGSVETRTLIGCAGLYADELAMMTGGRRDPRIIPFRGDYWALKPEAAGLVKGLIYPVPDPHFPFLGIHATRRIDGSVWLGPNAVLAFAREGYRLGSIRPAELAASLLWPGFARLAARYWRTGVAEMVRDVSKTAYLRVAQRYLPAIRSQDVVRAPSGVRAQAVTREGRLVDDFVWGEEEGVLHLRNAPSPGASSSLAIGQRVIDRLLSGA
jgi:L-2-hydroxyglutarate oxidase